MTAQTPDPLAYLGNDRDAHELFKDANNVIAIIFNMLTDEQREALEAHTPYLWELEHEALQRSDRAAWHFAFVLALGELAHHPEALQQAVQSLHQRMKDLLPAPYNVINTLDEQTTRPVLEAFGRIVEQ